MKWMINMDVCADLLPRFWPYHIAMNRTCMTMRVTLNPNP